MALYRSLVERLKNQHKTITELIGIAHPRLYLCPVPGKWSIHDHIAHVARYQEFFIERINIILENDTPVFERYKAEDDPFFEGWQERSTGDLIKILNADRQKLFTLIINIPVQKLSRTGIHKKFGEMTIIQWVEFFLLHEAHHLFTIFRLANDVDL
jgi:uncharacterized damage-inducible protein DinB